MHSVVLSDMFTVLTAGMVGTLQIDNFLEVMKLALYSCITWKSTCNSSLTLSGFVYLFM